MNNFSEWLNESSLKEIVVYPLRFFQEDNPGFSLSMFQNIGGNPHTFKAGIVVKGMKNLSDFVKLYKDTRDNTYHLDIPGNAFLFNGISSSGLDSTLVLNFQSLAYLVAKGFLPPSTMIKLMDAVKEYGEDSFGLTDKNIETMKKDFRGAISSAKYDV